MYHPARVACPGCAAELRVNVYDSVNGDRRPDLRQAILEDRFMRLRCGECGEELRLPPELVYFDQELGLWINARPLEALEEWQASEAQTLEVYLQTFGPFAAPAVQAIGAAMRARVSFGWAGLREKLLCATHGVDELALETFKVSLLTGGAGAHVDDAAELRLVGVDDTHLILAWLLGEMEAPAELLRAPRSALEPMLGEAWAPVREAVRGDYFVDMNRAMVTDEEDAALAG